MNTRLLRATSILLVLFSFAAAAAAKAFKTDSAELGLGEAVVLQ